MRVQNLVALPVIAAIVACTDTPVEPTPIKAVSAPVNHFLGSGLAPHEFAPRMLFPPTKVGASGATFSGAGTVTAAAQPNIKYWGGGVIHEQKFAAIYYSPSRVYANGPTSGSRGRGQDDRSLVGYFLNNLGESSYWNINSTYYDKIDGRKSFVQNSMDYDAFLAPKVDALKPGTVVTDNDMVFLIERGFADGTLKYDPNTLYAVFTGSGINLGGGFSHIELDYCAYHSAYWFPGGPIVQYSAIPYDADFNPADPFVVTNPDGTVSKYVCTFLTKGANNDLGADATVSALAHEIEETTTDPVSLKQSPYFAGWYDKFGAENGDKCAYRYGPTLTRNSFDYWNMQIGRKPFLVQQNWTNVAPQGCLTGLGGGGGSARQ